MRRRTIAILSSIVTVGATAALSTAGPARAADAVRDPAITTVVSEGVKGHAFGAAPAELLEDAGYVESEFLIGGVATGYDASPTALRPIGVTQPTVPALGPAAIGTPYRTRIIVRRPADPEAFNGTVLLEWMNVTSGYDVDSEWAHQHPELLRSGYAYVGVSAQNVGVAGLKAYDAVRYANLVHPGDAYSYDVFAQAAKGVRAPAGLDPLDGLDVERVLATGSSQSATALGTFVNTVHPGIERVIDGYLIVVGNGSVPVDLDVPVLRLLSEGEANGAGQPDGDGYRQWETAGASHADTHHGDYWERTQSRDWGVPDGTWPLTPRDRDGIVAGVGECDLGSFPRKYVSRAGLDALHRWVVARESSDVWAPPVAERIEVAGGDIVRDEHGNAAGGIRLAAIEVPTATYTGDSTECGPTLGHTRYFTDAELDALYPTHAGYVAAVEEASADAVAAGFLLAADAAEAVALAGAAPVGADLP